MKNQIVCSIVFVICFHAMAACLQAQTNPIDSSLPLMQSLTFAQADDGAQKGCEPSSIVSQSVAAGNGGFISKALTKPSVVSRTSWGCPSGENSPLWTPQYTTVTHLVVHHSATANTSANWAADVLSIWNYHTYTQGWGDIGYNYLIDPNGVIYEGRAGGDNVIGAHFSCQNGGTFGVCMLGTYTSVSPTAAALSSLKQLLAWKADQRGIDPLGSTYHSGTHLTLSNICGHRDANPAYPAYACSSTDCPGDTLYALLPSIRSDVYNIIHANLLPDLTISGAVVVSPTSVAGGGTIRVDWTEKNQGTAASTPAHNTKIFLSGSAYGTTYQIGYYGPMSTLGVNASSSYYANIVVPTSIPAGNYYVTAFIDCDQQVSEGSNEGNNIGSSTPTTLTVVVTPTRIISLGGNLAFGNVTVGNTAQATLTIYNNGNSTLTVSSISYPSGFSGAWSGTIGAGGSQNVTVTFSPASAISYSGTVTVNSDATSGANTITASGTGTATPTRIISLSGNLAFGNVTAGLSAQTTLTIYNTGNSTMTISSISYPSGFSANWSGTIVAGGSQPVTVTFSPVSATSYSGTVTVNSDKTSGVNSISASGTGTAAPTRIISLSGNLAFGSVMVGSSAQSTLTINNTGNSTMTISSISYPGGFSGNWSGTIAAGGSQPVTVTFSPVSATSYSGTVTVNSDMTSGVNTIATSGTGTAVTKIISLSGNLAFGNVTVGSTPQTTLTINNIGNSTMTVSSINYPSGFSGSWSGTITSGGSQPVTATFSPVSATSYGGTVTVNSDYTSGVYTIAASGTGLDTIPPALTIGSPANNAVVTNASLPVNGTASDNGYGNNGISSVTVNGVSASGGTASGSGTANWNATITLLSGANTVTVVAKDTLNNSTQKVVSVTYNPPRPIFASSSVSGGQLRTTLSGLSVGENIVFYVSSDLRNWTPLRTNSVLTGSTLTFTNTINPAMKNQFFRARVQ